MCNRPALVVLHKASRFEGGLFIDLVRDRRRCSELQLATAQLDVHRVSGGGAGGAHLRNQRGHRVLEVGCIVDRELEFELGE